ncbi:hypothetical protein WKW80_19900 [Variovorax humicola]|uniref:Uncharacterized protein n=1 Tax=Variovorax humicola TaxID=1769758 RepID=A0ABU8W4V2_9BURK
MRIGDRRAGFSTNVAAFAKVPTFMRREFPEHLARVRIEDPMAKTVAEGV